MAEALGLAASVIAVVGLAGQVLQGCQNIKSWVGDFNSAPKDIQLLMRELDSILESAKIAERLGKDGDANLQAHLEPALRLCLDAVDEIRKKIADANLKFSQAGSSRKSRSTLR